MRYVETNRIIRFILFNASLPSFSIARFVSRSRHAVRSNVAQLNPIRSIAPMKRTIHFDGQRERQRQRQRQRGYVDAVHENRHISAASFPFDVGIRFLSFSWFDLFCLISFCLSDGWFERGTKRISNGRFQLRTGQHAHNKIDRDTTTAGGNTIQTYSTFPRELLLYDVLD